MLLFALLWSLFASAAFADFGYTDQETYWTIDSGSNLVIQVSKTNGDITSIKYKGVEYNGYGGKNTQVESGLGPSTVTIQQFTSPASIIKVSVTYGTLKHYLFVRNGNDNVYIFTNKADASFTVHRYIVRMKGGSFPYSSSDTDFYPDGSSFIEATDVSALSDGTTWSKHFNGGLYGRVKDFDYIGVSKPGVGMYMIRSNHEKASGGPFFRSLQRRADAGGGDLYDIYHYDMGHTDPERFGLQGPSVLSFTDGSTPNTALFARNADWSWFDTLGIDGWVPTSGRGSVAGVGLANMKSGLTYTVGLSNSDAQYWATAASAGGAWQIAKALPGTYTLTVYKVELEVYNTSVTITAGGNEALHTITVVDPSDTTAIWRIGDWDGTPFGFSNFDTTPWKLTFMHPSDSRIASWDVGNFTVGTTATSSFPSYIWQDVNNGRVVSFRLTADQLTQAHTIRIGITEAYLNGRPQISVNNWTSSIPGVTNQASTRSLTVGTYRGNNVVLEYNVPATAWEASIDSWQTLTINVVTGSTGSKYLSGGISIDCVEMI
ncbi:hypothetical protein diail_11169 [Diaporthe ilicicola]|nr:hypothetical protein diail_11169 [Diaporthe ilicicola]